MTLPYNEIPANKSKLYPYPSNLNHIAVSVTNIEEVIAWYTKVLGFNVVKPPLRSCCGRHSYRQDLSRCFWQGL